MNNHELEKRVKSAYKNIAPDILFSILRDCDEQKGRVIMMQEKKKKNTLFRVIAGIAAALFLVVGGIMGIGVYNGNRAIASTVMLDVNPSIEIQVNKYEKVLAVNALNEDAEKVVGGMDFTGSDLDVTVNALIGSMLRNGYISEMANSILVTVDSSDLAAGEELQARLMEEINMILQSSSVTSALLGQTITNDMDLTQLADQYGITPGKAKLIDQIVKQNLLYSFADLVPMTINELNLLSESRNIHLENIETVGRASDASYIGESAAKAVAFSHAGIDASAATQVKCEFDWENGRMVYEVDFTVNGIEYEYDIDAKTGTVIKYEQDMDDDHTLYQTDGSYTGDPASTPPSSNYIGTEAAKSFALTSAGVTESAVRNLSCQLDYENGIAVYEVDFDAYGYEYDYEINALTGAVIKHEKEAE